MSANKAVEFKFWKEYKNDNLDNPDLKEHRLATKKSPFLYFIGWDSHESIAHEICKYSCLQNATVPVRCVPLQQHVLKAADIYKKPVDPKQNTEFTYLRFLAPYLSGRREGWVLFTDDDFMWRRGVDIKQLLDLCDDEKAVMCVQHSEDIQPLCEIKLSGRPQERYPCKNWSSTILFNLGHPDVQALTPDVINKEGGRYLHRFEWVKNREHIGSLPYVWNWLESWYRPEEHDDAKVIHWTDGGPYYPDYRDTHLADEWFAYLKEYERQLPEQRWLGPYERFSYKEPPSKALPGYPNSDISYRWTWDDDAAWQEVVKAFLTEKMADAKARGREAVLDVPGASDEPNAKKAKA